MADETDLYAPIPYDPSHKDIHTIKIVVAHFCSDSRNTTQVYYDAKDRIIERLLEQGIMVDFFRMNDPGVFMTKKAIEEIKGHIIRKHGQYKEFVAHGIKVVAEVHNVGHANARRKREFARTETYEPDQIFITKCVTNCGMSHAETVAKSLQNFILEITPTFSVAGKEMPIKTADDLKEFMKIAYKDHGAPENWDGDLLTWAKGIENLATHPREQIMIFDESVKSDPRFSGMELGRDMRTFAHVLSYKKNKVYRVDGKAEQGDVILGPLFREIRTNGKPADQKVREESQVSPLLVISDPLIPGARRMFVQEMFSSDSPAGRIFSIARKLDPGPFDIYSMLGIYYALSPKHLQTTYHGQMGIAAVGEAGAGIANWKIHHDDQIVSLIVKNFVTNEKLVVLPESVVDRRQHFPHLNRRTEESRQGKNIQTNKR